MYRTPTNGTDRFWANAAAFGALWGSMEITVGTFLHTIRFPLAGVLLASLGAALLVAQRHFVPDRGISLATGVVAAAIKSISPGGIILGPMIGISVEALLVDIVLLASPRWLPLALFAGFVSGLWPLMQKLLYQTVMYGTGVVDLYLILLKKAGSWLYLEPAQGWSMLAGLIMLCGLFGAISGGIGWFAGKRASRSVRLRPLGNIRSR